MQDYLKKTNNLTEVGVFVFSLFIDCNDLPGKILWAFSYNQHTLPFPVKSHPISQRMRHPLLLEHPFEAQS